LECTLLIYYCYIYRLKILFSFYSSPSTKRFRKSFQPAHKSTPHVFVSTASVVEPFTPEGISYLYTSKSRWAKTVDFRAQHITIAFITIINVIDIIMFVILRINYCHLRYSLGNLVPGRPISRFHNDVFGGQEQRSGMRRRPWWGQQPSATLTTSKIIIIIIIIITIWEVII